MATRYKFRLYLLALLVICGFGVLVARLYEIQITQGEHWESQLPGEKQVTVRIPGVRGEILDRNGTAMATNRASYEVSFNLKEIVEKYKEEFDSVPQVEFDFKSQGMERTRDESDIVTIVKETVLPGMMELGLAEDFNARQLQIHYRSTRGVVPYTYRRELQFEEFARFAENNFDLPGVEVTVKPSREYPYGSLASHILGYPRLPDIQNVSVEERRSYDFYVSDDFGVYGIEKSQDQYLRGKPGKRVLRQDEKGVIRGEIDYTEPKGGDDVYLTIDARVQMITEKALRAIGRGAAAVVDPRNGDILSLASVPSFDPNNFVPTVSSEDWDRYRKDKANPLFNRALSANPPGSTFKIPISLAGALSDHHRQNFYCAGSVQYGSATMRCWILAKGGSHGSIGLSDAIKKSCNCYYYQYGNATGIDNIVQLTTMMGLGRQTGIPLDNESPGIVPSPQWARLRGENWSEAYTAMTAIGQGFVETTPLQMALATATVANGGLVYQPRLIKKVVSSDGNVVVPDEPVLKHDLTEMGLTAEEVELVKRGMWKVVNETGGTARRARAENFDVSGKTGTAQTGIASEPTNAWFIAFAPYEEPELAVCVFVHHANSGGTCAAPIAGHIIKQVMAMKYGYEVALEPLEEASGHFDKINLVEFENSGLDQFVDGDDADGVVDLPTEFIPTVSTSANQPAATASAPSIQPAADSRGRVSAEQERVYRAERANRFGSLDGQSSQDGREKRGLFKKLFGTRNQEEEE